MLQAGKYVAELADKLDKDAAVNDELLVCFIKVPKILTREQSDVRGWKKDCVMCLLWVCEEEDQELLFERTVHTLDPD